MNVTEKQKKARLEVSDSNVNYDDNVDGWTKNGNLRNLDQYLGNISLTFTPDDATSIS